MPFFWWLFTLLPMWVVSAAAIGGMFIAKLAGYILQWTGEYRVLFIIASCAYLVNLLIVHSLNPRLKPMEFVTPQAAKT